MVKVPSCRELVTSRPFPFALQVLAFLGAFACGTVSLWCLITRRFGGVNGIREVVALLYVLILAIVVPAAELGLMQHPHLAKFARFLLSPLGRAFVYIFMGGALLGIGNTAAGWIVGACMLAIGVINIVASCLLKEF